VRHEENIGVRQEENIGVRQVGMILELGR